MRVRDSGDTLVCCIENMVGDRIMDYGASFHATYCIEELERFKLCSGKVRLANDKTLDIAGIGDVVLKTSFGTSWTLKDVRLPRRLQRPAVKGYKRLGDMSRIGINMLALKGNVLDVQKSMALHLLHQSEDPATMILLSKTAAGVAVAAQMKCDTAFGIRRVAKLSKAEILHLLTRFIEPENDSIVAEHSESFEDSGRSDKEYSEDGSSFMEGGFETPQDPSYVGSLNDTSTQHKSKGFQLAGQKENLECRLKEILYELIQAPRLWYLKFDSSMQKDK
ncbi:hypothetical protein Tco_1323666, partial [Tanacetum coccineum]